MLCRSHHLVLDVSKHQKSSFAIIIPFRAHGGANQLWHFVPMSDGAFRIQSRDTGKAIRLTDSGGAAGIGLTQSTPSDDKTQSWIFVPGK